MKPFYRIARLISKGIVAAKFDLYVVGEHNFPQTGPAIVTCNHLSWWDPVIQGVYSKKEIRFVTRKGLKKMPLVGLYLKSVDCIFVDREKPGLSFFKECRQVLRNNGILLMYPEGRRSKDKRLGEFKEGVERLAILYDVPIIPMGIIGTHKTDRRGFHTRYKVKMSIGRPLLPYDYVPDEYKSGGKYDKSKCDGKKLLSDLRNTIYSLSNPKDSGGLERKLRQTLSASSDYASFLI